MYRLYLELGFDIVLVSQLSYTSREEAEKVRLENYPDFPAMQVKPQEEVDAVLSRVVTFPVPDKKEGTSPLTKTA